MANTESTDLLGRASSSVAALTHTAHDLVGMLLRAEQQPEADGSLASLTRTVQAGSDAHWAVVARAAASLDAVAAESGDASGEVALLRRQRRELQEVAAPALHLPCPSLALPLHLPAPWLPLLPTAQRAASACAQPVPPSPSQAVLAQKGAIKEQVDLLRRLMGDVQLMGGLEDTQAEAQPG